MAATGTQIWSTGPALIYAAPMGTLAGSSGSPIRFAGTCEDKPTVKIDFDTKIVRNDLAGTKPADRMYGGKSGQVILPLNKFNFPVVQAMCTMPNPGAALIANATPTLGQTEASLLSGVDLPGDIGTLMIQEKTAFVLYLLFPYFALHSAMAGAVPGYRFVAAIPDEENLAQLGTEDTVKQLVFNCERVFDISIVNSVGGVTLAGAWLLYDFQLAGLPVND